MRLSDQDVDLFFNLMFSLQLYAGKQLGMISNVDTPEAYRDCPLEQMLEVRNALYEHTALVDSFIQENPACFPSDSLGIIAGWKQAVPGEFYIERLLQKHAVFIGSEDKVYGVLGLHSSFQEMVHPSQLPVYLKTVLLPFKGKIVYDGLLQSYNIYFGRGISSELKELYLAAKQNGKIIESLEGEAPPDQPPRRGKAVKDWGHEIDALVAAAQEIRGGAGQPAVHTPTLNLVKASLELAQKAAHDPDDLEGLWKSLQKVGRTARRVEAVLERQERYR